VKEAEHKQDTNDQREKDQHVMKKGKQTQGATAKEANEMNERKDREWEPATVR
jgi:hypothetical protein